MINRPGKLPQDYPLQILKFANEVVIENKENLLNIREALFGLLINFFKVSTSNGNQAAQAAITHSKVVDTLKEVDHLIDKLNKLEKSMGRYRKEIKKNA